MPTYYEFLELDFTASTEEIESAIERQYERWRRLVTHHDPAIVEKAVTAMRTLEESRDVLLDPAKRRHYDNRINPSGLADPQAVSLTSTPPPASASRSRMHSPTGAQDAEGIDVWMCPRCEAVVRPGSSHCSGCGYKIGRTCPQCAASIHAAVRFCSACGTNVKNRLRELVGQENKQRMEYEKAASQLLSEAENLIEQGQEPGARDALHKYHKLAAQYDNRETAGQVLIEWEDIVSGETYAGGDSQDFEQRAAWVNVQIEQMAKARRDRNRKFQFLFALLFFTSCVGCYLCYLVWIFGDALFLLGS